MGVEPGMADVFARYAQDHLFDEIDEIGIRDGANIIIDGYEFAPNFSIWTTIEECLNPPVVWEKDKGWFTTEPFSEHETFDFPEIGPIDVVNVEHEEVLLVPRWVKAKRVTFKYGLGDEFIGVLKTLHMLGLDNKEKINVKGVQVAPRDVVAACLPAPAHLGEKMPARPAPGHGSRAGRMEIPTSSTSNGQGFDPERVQAGMGLLNMRERALALGGCFEVHSQMGNGTRIRIEIPALRDTTEESAHGK